MRIKTITLALATLAIFGTAQAQNLVQNGDFEITTNGAGKQLGFNTDATGWSTNGYNFLFAANTADTSGAAGSSGQLSLWGPGNGAANGLTNSPTGGNFVAADGAFEVASIDQTIHGLVAGQKYSVSFDWAAAQQSGFTGPTTEQWQVSLGGQTQSTAIYSNANHGFSGWMHDTLSFTATGSSEVLSFLAQGTPNGEPPFSLLDNVSLIAAVPEPETWGLLIGGLGLVGFMARRRKAVSAV